MATSAQLREQIAAGRWDGPLAALYGTAPQELARQRARYCAALEQLPERDYEKRSAPTFIISNTVKGKGVSFMEGNHKWHGGGIGDEDLKIALADVAKMRKA